MKRKKNQREEIQRRKPKRNIAKTIKTKEDEEEE